MKMRLSICFGKPKRKTKPTLYIMNLFDYTYSNYPVHFELQDANVMVNATEMAKIFDKKVQAFTRNESTILFIEECLKSENSRFLMIKSKEDLIQSRQKSGTWMHRVLALKFAAWLNPKFELWVYTTIDELLFGHFRRMEESLKQSAKRKNRMHEIEGQLLQIPGYIELKKLQLEERQSAYHRGKSNSNQLDAFREMYKSTNQDEI